MVSFEVEKIINRSQQDIFDYVSNPANDVKWQGSAKSSEWVSEAPYGVGSQVHAVNRFMGRDIDSMLEITAWDPPGAYGQKSISGPIPFEINMQLEAQDEGTRLTIRGNAEAGGFFKLAEGLVGKQLQKQIEKDFETLKQVLESG
jgi:carbon monoxide dehydrogenase subunit G